MSVPVRDVASLRAPPAGHEKFPSWPVTAAQDTPAPLRGPITGGSSRSKSWTEHTEYPKEQPLTYTRPYMKRQHHSPSYNKQLKTVMERCEKLPAAVFSSSRRYSALPCVDREGVALGELDYAVPSPPERDTPALTQADLEAYLHHKQAGYAHSEGYHSYVSSADSSSTATPFLDRLRRDSEAAVAAAGAVGGRDSVVTTSSGSGASAASSSDTLKWHGSCGDVQHIAHSARVQTPQRHHSSEAVLYMDPQHRRKLYPVSTYTVQPQHQHHHHNTSTTSTSVADRIHQLEKHHKYTYLDPEKKHRVSDPTLKAIQKKALLSFYERHHGTWRSEPQLAVPQAAAAPQPPPRRVTSPPSRRASCASDYAAVRRGPVIVGPAISVDEWVPERPPKNPALRSYRPATPPPPSPPPTPDTDAYYQSDEPLPPPPTELLGATWQRPLPPVPPPCEPPPLHPRQSMRARITSTQQHRKTATTHHNNMSASKASYLASRRERDLTSHPGDTGSYKRTMSPGGECREPCSRLQPPPATTTTTTTLIRRVSITEPPPPLPDVLPSPPRLMTPPRSPATSPTTSPMPQPLQLMQRAELTLRVGASTSDAGCQTEVDNDEELQHSESDAVPRKKLQEEIECERLQLDLAEHLAPSDRLKNILVPGPEHRKPTDYVSASGLYKVELTSRCCRSSTTTTTPPASPPSTQISTTSAYFTTSEPKAKFLISSRDVTISTSELAPVTSTDLERKKEQLVNRLAKKLEVLRNEANAVADERRVNEELGDQVAKRVAKSARPHEVAKFRLHVDEVGQITALLLGLSGRLARAENALMSLDESGSFDALERKLLEDKRDKLSSQLTEAKQLKESIDKRSGHVSNILVQYLSADEYADYDHFINMKAKLIMDARDISDKIKLGEEQLQALKDTLADV